MMRLLVLHAWMLQLTAGWSLLEDVKFKTAYSEELEAYIDVPKFGKKLLGHEGERIEIKGYYLPLELTIDNTIILSRYPYASCFFCGGAGLESVIEVQFSTPERRFKADELITVEGRLRLNRDDVGHLAFILEDAKRLIWEN